MMKRTGLGLGTLLLGVLVGCSDTGRRGSTDDQATGGTSTTKPGKPGTPTGPSGAGEGGAGSVDDPDGRVSALMRRATDCDDLALRFREQLLERLDAQVEASILPMSGGSGGASSVGGMFAGGGFPGAGGPSSAGAAFGGSSSGSGGSFASGGTGFNGSAGSASGGGSSVGNPAGPEFTGTNTQVAEVDEPDFVKTDGQNLYIVQDQQLRVATAYPATSLAELASAPIQGVGLEMFLVAGEGTDDKQLIVYSALDGAALNALGQDVSPYSQWLKVTVLTLSGADLTVKAEYVFEGNYLSARRTDAQLRQVLNVYREYPGLRYYPTDADRRKAELTVLEQLQDMGKKVADVTSSELDRLFYAALVEVVQGENEATLAKIRGEDLVPRAFVLEDGALRPANMDCRNFYIPATDSLEPNITYVSSLALNALSDVPQGSALLGSSSNLYQNQSHLVLASPPSYAREQRTTLHAFELSGDEPLQYVASGEITGFVKDSFSLDEQQGDFHAVVSLQGGAGVATKLYTLQADGTDLEVVGETPELAPGETLRSVRFVGETAYLVTFRNTDPLFVVDLSQADAPTQLGELEIPGFSQYMHPIGDDKLLTIGSDAGSTRVTLRLFDVSDKTAPALGASLELADWGGSSAQIDHRAFTYFADRGLLAIPFSGYRWNEASEYEPLNRLSLIEVDPEAGFTERGAIDGKSLSDALSESGSCAWRLNDDARIERGTFIEDTLYAIASHGVVAAKVTTPAETIATLPLGSECPGGAGYGSGGYAGGGSIGGTGGGPGGNSWGGVGGAFATAGTSGTGISGGGGTGGG